MSDDLRAALARAQCPPPWIRRWESIDVHGITGNGVLTHQANVDLAVAAVNALPDLLAALDAKRDAESDSQIHSDAASETLPAEVER